MSQPSTEDLRFAWRTLEEYRKRFTTQHSDMHRALGIAQMCISDALDRDAEQRQLTLDDIT